MAAAEGDFDSQAARTAAAIREAAARGRGLRFEGGGSKRFCGEPPRADCDSLPLPTAGGVVAYEPSELFLCARAATPLAEIERVLAAHGQALAFEPPAFGAAATLGGTVSCGFSGPRRVAAGAARDFTLGARIIDGRGRTLSFGGRVIKNVAGFDVSRLLVGSFGTLGVVLEATLRVSPAPEAEATLRFEQPDPQAALDFLRRALADGMPLSADAWRGGTLSLRLSGAKTAVAAARKKLGGEEESDGGGFWRAIREHEDSFFAAADGRDLWSVVLPPLCPAADFAGGLIEWEGRRRWLYAPAGEALFDFAAARGGFASLFRPADSSARGRFAPLSPPLSRLQRRIKAAFDPAGILNPGRRGHH